MPGFGRVARRFSQSMGSARWGKARKSLVFHLFSQFFRTIQGVRPNARWALPHEPLSHVACPKAATAVRRCSGRHKERKMFTRKNMVVVAVGGALLAAAQVSAAH